MEKIYEKWVRDFDIDGFRIDTVKNVDMHVLDPVGDRPRRLRGPARPEELLHVRRGLLRRHRRSPRPYVTQGRLDATLDFPFQDAARAYASQGGSAQKLAARLRRRLQVHDRQGQRLRAGHLPRQPRHGPHRLLPRPGQPEGRPTPNCSRKDELANELMFLSRGNPVVYYGDEQGFTGSGGDKDARQTMFASKVADYLDDDEIGTDRTARQRRLRPDAPLYRQIAALVAAHARTNPALTRRRPDRALRGRRRRRLRLLAHRRRKPRPSTSSPSTTPTRAKTVTVRDRFARTPTYRGIYGTSATVDDRRRRQDHRHRARRSGDRPQGRRRRSPARRQADDHPHGPGRRRHRHRRARAPTSPAAARPGRLRRPDRQRHVADPRLRRPRPVQGHPGDRRRTCRPEHALRYKAVVVDSAGRTASATAASTTGTPPAAEIPTASSRDYAIVHYKRTDGDYADWGLYAWGDLADGEATTWPAEPPLRRPRRLRRLRLRQAEAAARRASASSSIDKDGDKDVAADRTDRRHRRPARCGSSRARRPSNARRPDYPAAGHRRRPSCTTTAPTATTPAGACTSGPAPRTPPTGRSPLQPVPTDAYGAVFEVPLAAGATSLSYILHKGDEKDLAADQFARPHRATATRCGC